MPSPITETLNLHLHYDVLMIQAGTNHIGMIAAIQTVRDLDVAQADTLLRIVPCAVLNCAPWSQARAAKRTLETAGARVVLQLCE